LSGLMRGQSISLDLIRDCFGNSDITYLALYYRPVRQGLMGTRYHPEAQRLHDQAAAAARAREAMFAGGMDVSAKSANLAQRQMQGQEARSAQKESTAESRDPAPETNPPKPTEDAQSVKQSKSEPKTENEFHQQKNLLDKLLS